MIAKIAGPVQSNAFGSFPDTPAWPGRLGLLLLLALGSWAGPLQAAPGAAELGADFDRPAGSLRPLHGINKGPILAGGLIGLTAPLRVWHPPLARLHDCHWPNPDVVDIHAVFPDSRADPDVAASYDFRLTDDYIAATLRTGAEVIYRL